MLAYSSLVLRLVYILFPIASLLPFVQKSQARFRSAIAGAWVGGMILGGCVASGYAMAMGGSASPGQVGLACYFAVALMLLLKLFDRLVLVATRWLLRVHTGGFGRWATAGVLRVAISSAVMLPWVMAAVMVYRPRVRVAETADVLLQTRVDDVRFAAADGTRVAGWYVPAETESNTTALLCHGLGSGRAGWLTLMDRLHKAGVNVLAIDLRAHGASGGQLCTFGDKESLDALAAVVWLKSKHAAAAGRIIGVGASMGSAALLIAAAEDDRIDGVVSLSTFDTLPNELADVARLHLRGPLGWLVRWVGLPMASLHTGVDLRSVRPIDAIDKIWPRPVMVVHATGDEIIPFEEGERLYRAASLPKQSLWVQGGSHNGLLQDPDVLKAVEAFIKSAAPSPVI